MILVSCGSQSTEIHIEPSGDLREYETIHLSAGDEYRVRVESTEGEVQLAEVNFAD